MSGRILSIDFKLKKITNSKLFFLFLFSAIFYQIMSGVIVDILSPETLDHISGYKKPQELFTRFFFLVLLAPFFETIFLQWLPIELLIKFKIRLSFTLLFSAIIFALAHTYNLIYIIGVFPFGLILAYYYSILRLRDKWIAFLSVMALHSAINLFAYINNYLLH